MDSFNYEYKYSKYDNRFKYSTISEDNKVLKESKEVTEYLSKLNYKQSEFEILSSFKSVIVIQDLIDKYSNNFHRIYYYEKSHSILIRGSMRVDVFHKFILDSRKFKFNDITLES